MNYSKKIVIKRIPKKSKLPTEIWEQSVIKIGGMGHKYSGTAYRSIDYEMEKKLMPLIVGVDPSSPEYPKRCEEFWADLDILVKADGIELEIGYDEELQRPLNAIDYIKYMHCLAHKWVAKSEEDLKLHPDAKVYIFDKNKEVTAKNEFVQIQKKAVKEYIKLSEQDRSVLEMVARNFGRYPQYPFLQRPEKLNSQELENYLYDIAQAKPEEFIAITSDKFLEVKSDIYKFVSEDIIKTVGNAYYYIDEKIGSDLQEAALWLKDKVNSGTYSKMKSQYEEKTKK